MLLKEFVIELLKSAEKAANLARVIRSEKALFDLLVQEKTGDQSNKRFLHDFKTLADVLIQETVRHDLSLKFDGLATNIHGEESNKFTNTLGETIIVRVEDNESTTAALLSKVLDGNNEASTLLARAVHNESACEPLLYDSRLDCLNSICLQAESIGIWIDPIDGTAQYIEAAPGIVSSQGVHSEGLRCVTVLIGVYDLNSGRPLIGCINQPFVQLDALSGRWTGRCVWGVSYNELNYVGSSCALPDAVLDVAASSRTSVTLSPSENEEVLCKLNPSFELVFSSGAGYKLLCTVDRLVDSYVLSKASSFKWDTCAPHAILLALGGGIIDLRTAVDATRNCQQSYGDILEKFQLKYHIPNPFCGIDSVDSWANVNGIAAYSETAKMVEILQRLA